MFQFKRGRCVCGRAARERGRCCCFLGDQNLVHQVFSNLLQTSEAVEADALLSQQGGGDRDGAGPAAAGPCWGTDTAAVGCSDPAQCPCSVPAELVAAGQAQELPLSPVVLL